MKRAVVFAPQAAILAVLHLPVETRIVGAAMDGEQLAMVLEHAGLKDVAEDEPLPIIEPVIRPDGLGQMRMRDWGYKQGRVWRAASAPVDESRRRRHKTEGE